MKRVICLLFLFICQFSFSQIPAGINYQGVARNTSGNALSKQNISVEFKIYQGDPSTTGTLLYTEFHPSTKTDTFGLYSLVIGSTSGSGTGTFASIPWSQGNIWLQVDIDPANGTNFLLIANTQLMSVPYALYAASAGGSSNISGIANNLPKINNTGNGLTNSTVFESNGSVGVSNPSPASGSILDIFSNSKGVLFPRLSYTQRTAVSTLHHGLTVFQTDNNSGIFPQGYWYYDSLVSSWLYLAPAQALWTLQGNYATTPGTHFIGTMDDKDFVVKTGNGSFVSTERMRVLSTTNGGNIQFGNQALATHYIFPPTKGAAGQVLQLDPGGSNKLLWANMGSGGGLPIGQIGSVLWNNNGTAAGWVPTATTSINTDGTNIGLGVSPPVATLDIFSNNTVAGLRVVITTTTAAAASFNINNSSSGNVVLDVSTAGSGNAINATSGNGYAFSGVAGNGSGVYIRNSSSNQATIDAANTNSTSGAPALVANVPAGSGAHSAIFSGGIGMATDNIYISSGGAQDYVLTSDPAGKGIWKQLSINTGFSAFGNNSQTVVANSATQLFLSGLEFDDAGAFNTATSKYTVPSTGVYHFDITVNWLPVTSGGGYSEIQLLKNGTIVTLADSPESISGNNSQNLSTTIKLAAGDIISVMVFQNSVGNQVIQGAATGQYTRFSGYRIY